MNEDNENESETASACKRQKRANSETEDHGDAGATSNNASNATEVGELAVIDLAPAAPKETLNAELVGEMVVKSTESTSPSDNANANPSGSLHNNLSKGDGSDEIAMENQEEPTSSTTVGNNGKAVGQVSQIADKNNTEEEGNVSMNVANSSEGASRVEEYNLTTESAAIAVIVASSRLQPSAMDSDDEADALNLSNTDAMLAFNRPRISASRSYRNYNIEVPFSDSNDSTPGVPLNQSDEGAAANEPTGEDVDVDVENLFSDSNTSTSDSFMPANMSDAYSLTSDSDTNEHEDDTNEMRNAQREKIEASVKEITEKEKPPYNWNIAAYILQREHNIFNSIGWRGGQPSPQSFAKGFYGSAQAVERLTLTCQLQRHKGCVNCLNFNAAGDLICSGSDDLRIIIWDWANSNDRHYFKTRHTANIFQAKFIDNMGCFDIVTSSRDGQIRRSFIPPSGGTPHTTALYVHKRAVHKIVVVPNSRQEILSAGEDGIINHYDLRTSIKADKLLTCYATPCKESPVRLFSIAHHPFAPEFCVSGCDEKLRVYDKRKLESPVYEMYPEILVNESKNIQITCAVYNYSGSEILASYSDAGIYLFDNLNYKKGEYLHSYEGHINSRTIKGVNFFGPRSEYIVSGSDCGHVFFWDKNTESIINYMEADNAGVVNCLEPHPSMPVLATSGLDHNVKIWAPTGEKTGPDQEKLKELLRNNLKRNYLDAESSSYLHNFISQFLNSTTSRAARRRLARRRTVNHRSLFGNGGGAAGGAHNSDSPSSSQMSSSTPHSSSADNDPSEDLDSGSSSDAQEGWMSEQMMQCRTQ